MKNNPFRFMVFSIICLSFFCCKMELDLPESFLEMIAETTKNNSRARISVGIIKNGTMEYTVYGENGVILPQKEYVYEIGSITKTFTGSLLCKAIQENKVSLDDSIKSFIDLSGNRYYPTFRRLVTHTSGYKDYYFDLIDTTNGKEGNGNQFYGISAARLKKQIEINLLVDRTYPYQYSNFGISAAGAALAEMYGTNFPAVMNSFIFSDLGLENTRISDGSGDLGKYWKWNSNDAYIPAGGIVSTISDMMTYTYLHMTEKVEYLALGHTAITKVNANSEQFEKAGIHLDAVGIGWCLDTVNNTIWHNGGTTNYNSYLAFNKEKQTGVVILSNLPPNYRISATVMGVKLLADL